MWDSIAGLREEWGYRRLTTSTTATNTAVKEKGSRKTDELNRIAVWVQVVGGMPLLGWRFPWIGLNVAQGIVLSPSVIFSSLLPHIHGANMNPLLL